MNIFPEALCECHNTCTADNSDHPAGGLADPLLVLNGPGNGDMGGAWPQLDQGGEDGETARGQPPSRGPEGRERGWAR